ncbi:MAG: TrkH family potassium uptake protein [Ruminiclostridium sp.]|nr:TrkH family potassium uptake protein [Ruminiclostridium sp.]
MNYKLMLRMMGYTLLVETLLLLLPLAVALIYKEDPTPFLYTILPLAVVGFALSRVKSKADFFSREGFVVAGLIWVVLSLFGALPFWFSGCFDSFADCLFEIVSGFTTSGATILADIEVLPRGILFWRSFASWVGGMGVLLFTLAFLPKAGGRTQILVKAELPGPLVTKLVPKTAQSAKILYTIYFALTFAEIFAFCMAGMPFYDAVVSTFACVCTGGFCVMNASFAAYNTACQVIAIVFMILGSINFTMFFLAFTGRGKQVWKSDELRFFLGSVAVASALLFVSILPLYDSAGTALKDAVFQATSIISTSGFCTTDYNLWPPFAQVVLVLLMFIGGCSGSTAGSIKCGRILLAFRSSARNLLRLSHPRAVKVVKLDGKVMSEESLNTIYAYFILFFLLLGGGCLVVSLDGVSLTTAFTATLGCLTNVGPGLDGVGPAANFSGFSSGIKYLLSLMMLIGRLEIFPILLLFHPATWRRS